MPPKKKRKVNPPQKRGGEKFNLLIVKNGLHEYYWLPLSNTSQQDIDILKAAHQTSFRESTREVYTSLLENAPIDVEEINSYHPPSFFDPEENGNFASIRLYQFLYDWWKPEVEKFNCDVTWYGKWNKYLGFNPTDYIKVKEIFFFNVKEY